MLKIKSWIKNCIKFVFMTDFHKHHEPEKHKPKECLEVIEELVEEGHKKTSIIKGLTDSVVQLVKEIGEQTGIIKHQVRIIDRLSHPQPPQLQQTHLVLTQSINKQKFILMNLSLVTPGGASAGILAFLDENLAPINGAVFQNIVLSGLDNTIATATTDGTSQVSASPVAVGAQDLTVDTDVTYFDTLVNGQRTVHKKVVITVTVSAKEILQNTTLVINFGPQAEA